MVTSKCECDVCVGVRSKENTGTTSPLSLSLHQIVGEKQKLVIVNLQATPLDALADIRVFAKCDDLTRLVMAKLGMDIPQFRLKRQAI